MQADRSSSKGSSKHSVRSSKSDKITEGNFPIEICWLAMVAKAYVQQQAALAGTFPPKSAEERNQHTMMLIKEGVELDKSKVVPSLASILKDLIKKKDKVLIENLITYVQFLHTLPQYSY